MARALGLTYEVMVNLHNLGDVLVRLDDLPRAYGAFQQSLALCDECGFERLANHNRMFLAYLDGVQGDGRRREAARAGHRLRREPRLHLGRHRRAPAARAAAPPRGAAARGRARSTSGRARSRSRRGSASWSTSATRRCRKMAAAAAKDAKPRESA